ncbi:hypothetical protein FHG87_008149 [Trinorchestia longiramus]|nr:hypothetical protein FHG87_008149 [Trinorchestia longiramus]
MTWRDLTSSDSNMKKETIEKTKEKMQIIFTELVAFSFVMNSCSTDEGDLHMKKKGFYFVRDAASAAKTLAMLDAFPPKVCVFQWHDKSLGSEELLNKVLRAVIQWDCFVIWINDDSWEERKQRFDDEYLQLLTNGKAQLVGFLGRLSSDGWPLVPTTALQVTPIITCVSDFNALSSCPSEFEQLKVCIPKSMLLNELKPLRSSASRQPIVLAVADMTDADIDWLLQALNVLLPFRMLSNLQQARPAFQICLFTCKMSLFGHSRLCLELPGEVVRVEVQDYTNNPQIRSFLQKYSLRNCAFIYHTEQVAKELRGLLI